MKTRQNPLSRFEAFMQRLIEGPFAFLFPSRLEPVEVARKLERAMEDNVFQGVDRLLAPNVYDVYLSIKDHQRFAPSQAILVREWQEDLVNLARQRHYTLRSNPVLRLHADSSLRPGQVHIEAELVDRQHRTGDPSLDGEVMETQALSAEQLAQLRAQLQSGQLLPGIDVPAGSSMSGLATARPAPPMPQAWLTIRLPQGQQIYRIEKPVINIGRQLNNDIIVEDKRVSRYHAQIKYQPNGQFMLFDLGSTNGITVNGMPGVRQHTLRSGDRFTIGSYDFYFERR
uniref:FHA domain-containing protein n=1 Tax=Thermogemmatispora argillosa TaxID=2045280 RepID=A0A455T046_9CHLR|nr:hypothetical protein KTA_09180 [Thermogemmatispora argillosa]